MIAQFRNPVVESLAYGFPGGAPRLIVGRSHLIRRTLILSGFKRGCSSIVYLVK